MKNIFYLFLNFKITKSIPNNIGIMFINENKIKSMKLKKFIYLKIIELSFYILIYKNKNKLKQKTQMYIV